MTEELTEAESAVAEALAREWNLRRSGGIAELQPRDFADDARIAVAAARPLLAAEHPSHPATAVPVVPEPTAEATGHAVTVTAGTYYDEPWIYLTCACGWRLGFSTEEPLSELARAAAVHTGATDRARVDQAKHRAEITASVHGVADESTLADLLWALDVIETMTARTDAIAASGGVLPQEVQEFIDGCRHWDDCLGDEETCQYCVTYAKYTTNKVAL